MPMAMATCWLSATARMAIPLRDMRKNQPNALRKTILTTAPSTWMGGMKSGPSTNGSSLMGKGSVLVPAPKKVGPTPRRIEASPMVAITTAITGRPMSLRRTTRSRAKPKTTTTPSAMSEYMSPISTPFDMSRKKKPRVSDMSGRPFHVLDPDLRLDDRLPAVLVGDGRGQVHLVPAGVERVDDRRVFLGDETPPYLAGACHLGVVGFQVLVQEKEAPDLRGVGKRLIPLPDLLCDEFPHLGLLGQVHVARVGQHPPLGPVAHRVEVDGDHGGHEVTLMAEGDGLADERAVLELVLEELRREGRAVGEGAHVLGAVDDHEMATRIDEAGVPGVEPAVGVDDLAGRLLVLEVALEDRASTHEHLAALGDLDLDARDGAPGARGIRLGVRLQGHEPARLRRSVHLLEVDPDGAKESEGVGPEGRAPGERPLGLPEAELVAHGAVDEELAEGGGQAQARRHGLAL